MQQTTLENSRAIKSIQHDGTTLRVHMESGSIYDYEDVSTELVNNMIKAEDATSFFVRRIMPDRVGVPVLDSDPFPRVAWT